MKTIEKSKFSRLKITPPHQSSDKKNWYEGQFGITNFNAEYMSVSKNYKSKQKIANSNQLELILTEPFTVQVKNAYINQRGIVFDNKRRVVKESLNSYYEWDHVIFTGPLRFVQRALNKFARIFSLQKHVFILNKILSFQSYAKQQFEKAKILELDKNFKYVIFFDYYYANFTHFTIEAYPRLYNYLIHLPEDERKNLKVIVPPKQISQETAYSAWDFIEPCLNALNITEEQRVYLENDKLLKAPLLDVPSQIKLHPSIVHSSYFLVNKYKSEQKYTGYDKIYISRKKATYRKIVNEQDCIKLLEKSGFKEVVMEDISFMEKINIMQQAKIVVTQDSSSFTNIVFSNPKTKILILTFDRFPIYTLLASSIYDMNVCYQICEPENKADFFWYSSNMIVNLTLLEQKLMQLQEENGVGVETSKH